MLSACRGRVLNRGGIHENQESNRSPHTRRMEPERGFTDESDANEDNVPGGIISMFSTTRLDV